MRKEVNLSEPTIIKLQRLADKEKRELKPHMEKILTDFANGNNKVNQISMEESIKIVKRKKKK